MRARACTNMRRPPCHFLPNAAASCLIGKSAEPHCFSCWMLSQTQCPRATESCSLMLQHFCSDAQCTAAHAASSQAVAKDPLHMYSTQTHDSTAEQPCCPWPAALSCTPPHTHPESRQGLHHANHGFKSIVLAAAAAALAALELAHHPTHCNHIHRRVPSNQTRC